ncbi:hypothetical protein [Nisaea sp.]|uniref:hypothetical protein n=1 Tax=Nisaea sp. TaxID=2024842 RepID=UPI003B519556
MANGDLWRIFTTHKGRVVNKWKHYLPIYERYFEKFINQSINVLEIGIGEGGSLQMWKAFFGPHARIVGVDVVEEKLSFEEDQIQIRIGDQSDERFLRSIVQEFGGFDVIIDDGSHQQAHIRTAFDVLYPALSRNGVYVVEDLHTAYWESYGGGYLNEESFIEFAKSKIDELHADYDDSSMSSTKFTRTTVGIHFYDSVCVFERGQIFNKKAPYFGSDQA